MRAVSATCPTCGTDVEAEVEVFWEGGWVAQFDDLPRTCPEGCEWTEEEREALAERITINAVEPREPSV